MQQRCEDRPGRTQLITAHKVLLVTPGEGGKGCEGAMEDRWGGRKGEGVHVSLVAAMR
jgi:hypothetical protein